MKDIANNENLFEGIGELIANVVFDGKLHTIRLKSTERTNLYEVVGNAAVKADEPLLETQLLEGMTVRVNLELAHQLIERYKEESKKGWDRSEVYKQKYEDAEYEKESMREDYEELLRAKDEEIRAKDKEITKLRAQLEYVDMHPQIVTYVQGNQQNNATDNRSQVAVKEMKVEPEGVGVQVGDADEGKINEEVSSENVAEDIKICRFIAQDRIRQNTTLGRTEEERIDTYNRRIYRESQNPFPKFVKFLKSENDYGNMSYDTEDYKLIYEHFVECYGELHANFTSFRNACKGVMNGVSRGFFWRPHK
jgi:hypothetical protein